MGGLQGQDRVQEKLKLSLASTSPVTCALIQDQVDGGRNLRVGQRKRCVPRRSGEPGMWDMRGAQ